MSDDADFAERRRLMVEHQLVGSGITDSSVLVAMAEVRREAFVPPDMTPFAYSDAALSIGAGQTISQPLIGALMAELACVAPDDRVLDVGTGSGYGAAVLSRLAAEVYSVERIPHLAEAAQEQLSRLGYTNIAVRVGDGSQGWPAAAPFDAILWAAAARSVLDALREQLVEGGRLVISVGGPEGPQRLVRIVRQPAGYCEEDHGPVAFVSLIVG